MRTRLIPLLAALLTLVLLFHVAQAQAPSTGKVNRTSNLRDGPGTAFPIVGSALPGAAVQIVACNDDCTWYQLSTGEWIAAFLVDRSAAPVPTSTPTPIVTTAAGLTLTLVSWNVESGGALQNVVADRIAAFDGVDIWGLSEVNAIDAEAYEFGAEEGESANFDSLLGTTGRADRLLLMWDAERFEEVNSGEMLTIGETGRAPLWVQLRDRASGQQFIVMVNHLHRSNDGIRHRQATALNAWAATQDLPIIAMGDYNFDWNLPNGKTDHDLGYDNLTANGVWEWVRPAKLVTTQCSGWPCGYNSVLDFFFVAGPAQDWQATSTIVVTANDFPDDLTTPDHRPVMAVMVQDGVTVTPVVSTTVPATETVLTSTATSAPVCPQPNGNVNVRSGPGTGYAVVGRASDGECVVITGRTEAGDWFQLNNGNWIAAFLIVNAPPMSDIAIVDTPTPVPTATPEPVTPTATPVPTQPTPVQRQPQCDPNYAGACIPIVDYDLDCKDVRPARRFQSIGSDPHNFDGDNDGLACES